jgi:hypothetical protein
LKLQFSLLYRVFFTHPLYNFRIMHYFRYTLYFETLTTIIAEFCALSVIGQSAENIKILRLKSKSEGVISEDMFPAQTHLVKLNMCLLCSFFRSPPTEMALRTIPQNSPFLYLNRKDLWFSKKHNWIFKCFPIFPNTYFANLRNHKSYYSHKVILQWGKAWDQTKLSWI